MTPQAMMPTVMAAEANGGESNLVQICLQSFLSSYIFLLQCIFPMYKVRIFCVCACSSLCSYVICKCRRGSGLLLVTLSGE